MTYNLKGDLIKVFLFLSILLIGADRLSFNLFGYTFRIVQLFFVIFAFFDLQKLYKIDLKVLWLYSLIVLPHLFSLFYSYNIIDSLMYLFWVVYNFLFIIVPVINYIEYDQKIVWNYYMWSFRIVGILTILHSALILMGIQVPFILNNLTLGIPRPSVWFYEPSYLATYMILYFGISLYLYQNESKKKFKYDLFFQY